MEVSTLIPLAHSINATCRRLGVGRTILYELLASGELRAIKLGSRTLITESELLRFLANRLGAAA